MPPLLQSAMQMSAATAISRITGFLRVAALASALGLLRLADAYNLANVMPNMIYELLMGGILSSLFIPVFIDYMVKDRAEAWKVASIVTNLSFLVLLLFALIGMLFAEPIVRLLTILEPGGGMAVKQTEFFFRFFVPQIVFYGLGAVFTGLLNSHRKFLLPSIAPIINNLTVIATVVFAFMPVYARNPQAAVVNLAVGTTAGVVMMAVVQLPAVFRLGWKYNLTFDFRHEAIARLGRLAIPVIGYVACNMVGLAVTYNLAFSRPGGITAYQYAWNFFQLPYGIFAVSISTALFPSLSELVSSNEMDDFKKKILLGLKMTGFVMIPAAAGILALSRPIISLFLQHGRFDAQATAVTAPVLSCFALGLLSFSVYMFLTRVFYALKDTKTPLIVNALGVPVNIVVNLALLSVIGIPGLALGHAITYTGTATALWVMLNKNVGAIGTTLLLLSFLRAIVFSIPAAAAAIGVAMLFGSAPSLLAQSLKVGTAIAAAATVYIGVVAVTQSEELAYVARIFKKGKLQSPVS